MNEIKKLLEDYVPKHSEFQIDHFIVGGQGDSWAQYKQALREIKTRHEMLIQLKEEVLLESLNGNGRRFFKFTKLSRVKARIEAARAARKHEALVENLKHTERELNRFVLIASKIKKHLGAIDDDKRKALEADSWYHKARRLAGLDMLTSGGHLSRPTVELILSLPQKEQDAVLTEILASKEPFKLLGL
jgi:hypothetical protein